VRAGSLVHTDGPATHTDEQDNDIDDSIYDA
jgi:hypothetical protein